MPTRFTVYTPDLEQSGQHNSIWALPETRVSPWATLPHWWDRLTPQHKQAAGVGVTARCHDSSCRYLPGRSQLTCTETLGADLKAMPSLSSMWLIVSWLHAVNWGDRNKRIRHQKNLAMSQSLFESDNIKRQEMVTAALWRSQTCASVYSWLIGAGTETTYLWPCTNSRFLKVETGN